MAGKTTTAKKIFIVLFAVLFVGMAAATTYLFLENKDLNEQLTLTTEEKNKRLVAEINEVYDLPDEEPVVAIVTNPEEFKSQYPVFDNAEAGDYLLFFRKNRLNVLYRQDEKRVVKTANVVVPITVELVGTQAAVDSAEEKLKDFGNQITVVKTVRDGITQSFIFDVDDDQAAEIEQIADVLSYEVGATLPSSITPGEQTEIIVVVSDSQAGTSQPVAEQPTEQAP